MKGQKPKTCIECPCVNFGENGRWDYCQAKVKDGVNCNEYSFLSYKQIIRPSWCPIVDKEND